MGDAEYWHHVHHALDRIRISCGSLYLQRRPRRGQHLTTSSFTVSCLDTVSARIKESHSRKHSMFREIRPQRSQVHRRRRLFSGCHGLFSHHWAKSTKLFTSLLSRHAVRERDGTMHAERGHRASSCRGVAWDSHRIITQAFAGYGVHPVGTADRRYYRTRCITRWMCLSPTRVCAAKSGNGFGAAPPTIPTPVDGIRWYRKARSGDATSTIPLRFPHNCIVHPPHIPSPKPSPSPRFF